jgi:hypothetical protein
MECDAFVRQDNKKMKVVGALRYRTQNSGSMATGNRVFSDSAFLCLLAASAAARHSEAFC